MTTNPSQRFKRLLGLGLGLAVMLAALAIVTHRMTRQHEQKLATESLAELQDEAKRSPTDARVFWHRARRAGQQGQNSFETRAGAMGATLETDNEALKKATTLAPDNAYAYLLLAQCCEKRSRWTETQRALDRAQQLAP